METKKDDVLHPNGLFNPTLRFAFTNITSEDFLSYWDGQPITVKAGKTVEVSHHLAVKMTKEMVDKIMIGNAKLDELKNTTAINPQYRSPQGMSLGVPAARKIWEDQIIKELTPDEESPDIVEMRAKLKAEILAGQNKEQAQPVHIPTNLNEFAELGKDEIKVDKKPIKLKEVQE